MDVCDYGGGVQLVFVCVTQLTCSRSYILKDELYKHSIQAAVRYKEQYPGNGCIMLIVISQIRSVYAMKQPGE